ncbi:YoaK family protein [Silvimonas iriomotensis]|uniref:Membrane protein n=1 Tax=Silvimonas iriomotensis TaxID=449662 RepID=A0ABQ2PEN6_9NEIS|nr:DUF1275 family protein [Silvimonas iriomotensis]GGP23846.1 membrane protein [Silvimonas iriomotensis]
MKRDHLPGLLSALGGYVDTAGFLALQGLFTAHVTGNFVTLGAALAFGSSGVITKLLALPVFCLVVALVRLASTALNTRPDGGVTVLLLTQTLLLALGGAFALALGPFTNGDHWSAMLTGLTLVAAMAIQNGVHRIHLPSAPPTTLMTGSTTQIVIDAVDLWRGLPEDLANQARTRLRKMGTAVVAFALGCAAAALLFYGWGRICLLLPPLLSLAATRLARLPADGAR